MTKKILIADDNQHNRELLTDLLARFKAQGVTLLTAEDGDQTLALTKSEKPDLILLDVEMPGVDGYEICKQVKNNPDMKDIYIIMVTAQAEVDSRRQAAALGVDEYITKPFDIRLVRDRVRSVLGLKNT